MSRRGEVVAVEPISLPVRDAAAAIGISESALRAMQRNGDIEFRYPTSHPVVLVADLKALIESAPTEPRAISA